MSNLKSHLLGEPETGCCILLYFFYLTSLAEIYLLTQLLSISPFTVEGFRNHDFALFPRVSPALRVAVWLRVGVYMELDGLDRLLFPRADGLHCQLRNNHAEVY